MKHPESPLPSAGIRRREFMLTAAGAAMGFACGRRSEAAAPDPSPTRRPNILWITFEDTSAELIGCYGNRDVRTPNLDRLAAEGVRLTSAFSTAPVCSPSRSTIFTGCLAECLGTAHHRSRCRIPERIKGFPYYLRRMGYFTSNNLKTDYNIEGERRVVGEAWDECRGGGGWGTTFDSRHPPDTWDENAGEAGWWHRRPGQPFFSVFNLMTSHQSRTMTDPHPWYVKYVRDRLPAGSRTRPEAIQVPPFYRDSPEMRRHMSRVCDSINLMDIEVGRILDRLEKDGLKDDTLVFCFADHGEGMPRGKTSALALGFHVPFIAYFPPAWRNLSPWAAGTPADELVSSSEDVAPTMLSLAGIRIPDYMTGRALLGGQRRAPRPYVWGGRNRIDESPDLSRSATDGRFFYTRVYLPQLPLVKFYKYGEVADITRTIRADAQAGCLDRTQAGLFAPSQPVEYLHDLRNDPWTIRNLAADPTHRSRLQAFRTALQEHLLETRDIHFLPEFEMARRARRAPAYEFRRDAQAYPLDRILEAANLVGSGSDAIDEQIRRLHDPDPTVRYWAAIGLDAQGDAVQPDAPRLLPVLADPHPSVRLVVAGVLWRQLRAPAARAVLEDGIRRGDEHTTLHALQVVQYLREGGTDFAPVLREIVGGKDARIHDRSGAVARRFYDSFASAEVTLHFFDGAPA